tara:strand:- start:2213 stop:2536 length:324 start_codon:yes stop_codon:yes gene_type:complete
MEGISDGMAVDHCYYCALLYPELDACPKCENRFRYRPAQMRDATTVEGEIATTIAAFRNEPSLVSATALLELWHAVEEQIEPMLAQERIDIADLRWHFEHPNKSDAP